MGHIQKPDFLRDIADTQGRILQQFLCLFNPDSIEDFRKILAGMLVQQLAQMPLAHVNLIRHIRKLQLLPVIFLYVCQGVLYDKAAGRAVCLLAFFPFRRLRLLFSFFSLPVSFRFRGILTNALIRPVFFSCDSLLFQVLDHNPDRFLQFIHLRRL